MRSVHGNGGAEEAAISGALFSLCGLKFIVNENDRPSLVLLGQHTAHVFIESCTTSELVLFSGDVDNTLHMYLLKKNMHTAIEPYTCTMALQLEGLRTPPATGTATATVTLPTHKIIRGVIVKR